MTRHLSPEDFVDAIEGAVPAATTAHLGECEACRTELAELHATLAESREVEAAEPSPLFWDHFSTRVREATSQETAERRWSLADFGWKPIAALVLVAGALAIGIYVRPATTPEVDPTGNIAGLRQPTVEAGSVVVPALEDDGSWDLVTALASELDWNELRQATTPVDGTADALIEELTSDQREALARLLQKEMGDF